TPVSRPSGDADRPASRDASAARAVTTCPSAVPPLRRCPMPRHRTRGRFDWTTPLITLFATMVVAASLASAEASTEIEPGAGDDHDASQAEAPAAFWDVAGASGAASRITGDTR